MSNKAIYVDFDECLIHGFHAGDNKQPSFEELKKSYETAWIPDEGETYAIIIRPGAKEFLQSLQKITPNVFILTAGLKNFQTKVAEAAGLLGLVKGLYGRDSKDVPQFTVSVLIDDLWIQSQNTYHKFFQMGVIDNETMERIKYGPWNQESTDQLVETITKNYIQIPHFTAEKVNDNGFAEVLPKIQLKLNNLDKEVDSILQEKIITSFTESKITDR